MYYKSESQLMWMNHAVKLNYRNTWSINKIARLDWCYLKPFQGHQYPAQTFVKIDWDKGSGHIPPKHAGIS